MFDVTKNDIDRVIETVLISKSPLKFKQFPSKEKKKYILTAMASHLFKKGKTYTEKEVKDILSEVLIDHVTLRRYLIDYHFLARETDGSAYWLLCDLDDFKDYQVI